MTTETKSKNRSRDEVIAQIPLTHVTPSPQNPRKEFDEAEIRNLADSLAEHGVLEPIIVRRAPNSKGRYELIIGERRLRAAALAGWTHISCIVRDVSDEEIQTLQLVENLQRVDLNPIEIARTLQRICRKEGDPAKGKSGLKTQAEAAKLLGRTQSWVNVMMRLLTLPDRWQQRILAGEVSSDQGLAIARYASDPRVLGRIEEDMAANPWAYRTTADVGRSAKLIADEIGVPRKPHGNARPRGSQRMPSAEARRENATPVATAAPAAAAGSASPVVQTVDADALVAAIAELADVAALGRIIRAATDRRDELTATTKEPGPMNGSRPRKTAALNSGAAA